MLTLNNLSYHSGDLCLLDIDQLQLKAGEMLGLLGPNGAGKSTLLKALTGELPAKGEVLFHGKSRQQWSSSALARHMAVLPQASQLTFPFLADEVVALGLTPLKLSHQEGLRQIERLMKLTDCHHLAKRSYPSLSGGERQRVQLARVLLQLSQAEQAPLLLLDEPTSAQDLGQQHSILKLAQELARDQGYGVVAILHDLNQVLHYCHQCCLLADGKVAQQGKPYEVLRADTVEAHWQYRPKEIILENGQPILV